jgi:hypothetical protein
MRRRKRGRDISREGPEIRRCRNRVQGASVGKQRRRCNCCAQKRVWRMISAAADVARSRSLLSRGHGFMTSAAMRLSLRGCEWLNAKRAGGLQGKACYRSKRDNSSYPPNHRTKSHVHLSLACLESRFYCMAVSARDESTILCSRNVYCWRSQEVTFVRQKIY